MQETASHHDGIVITGAGIVCALGLNKFEVWDAVVRGSCGIQPLTEIEQAASCNKGGGQAPALLDRDGADQPREVRYLHAALTEALREAEYPGRGPCPSRCGIVLGTTLGGMRAGGEYLRSGDIRRLTRFTADAVLRAAIKELPISGFATTTCSACASGLSSIGLAMTLLRAEALDLVIAGGYDPISEYAYAGFNSLRLVADGPIMPFTRDRQGMKLGEGYGIVVLERAGSAAARGATVQGRVLGFGESSDAHHLTQPHPEGDGAARAILAALADAKLDPRDISMLAAHATATPNNDAAEFQAYRRVFGSQLRDLPVVAFKSHLGHTLGGAGAVEFVLSMLALQHQRVPPTANVLREQIEFDGLRLSLEAEGRDIRHTLNLSMGFGGANACIVLGESQTLQTPPRKPRSLLKAKHQAVVTGIGVIAPGCIGRDRFLSRLGNGGNELLIEGSIDEAQLADLINARRTRRMSEFAKLLLAATTLALREAGVEDHAAFASDCGAILGTTHGAVGFSEAYYRQVVSEGINAANPMLFAEGVPNVGSAQLSLMLGIRGGTQTMVGSRTAGLDALRLAALRIENGMWERAIIGAAEEFHPLICQAYARCGAGDKKYVSAALVMIIESQLAAQARGARQSVPLDSESLERGAALQVFPETDFFSVGPLLAIASGMLNREAAALNQPA